MFIFYEIMCFFSEWWIHGLCPCSAVTEAAVGQLRPFSQTLVFFRPLHAHLRVVRISAQLLPHKWASFLLSLPKQLDFADPQKEREGKSAQDSTWGNSLADDCKVAGCLAEVTAAAACMPVLPHLFFSPKPSFISRSSPHLCEIALNAATRMLKL